MKKQSTARQLGPIALAVATALGASSVHAGIASGEPVGDPIKLLDLDAGMVSLRGMAVTADADGDAIVAWSSVNYRTAPALEGVYYRRVSADGSAGEIHVLVEKDELTINVESVDVAMDADGDAIVAWESTDNDTGKHRAGAQWIAANGEPEGSPVVVAEDLNLDAVSTDMDAAGNAVVAWEKDGNALFQRYSPGGTALTPAPEQANITPGISAPSVSVGSNGHFVIGWQDADLNLWVRAFSPVNGEATAVTGEILAHDPVEIPGTTMSSVSARFAVDSDGDFAAAWSDYVKYDDPDTPDATKYSAVSVAAKRFHADGSELTADAVSLHDDDHGTAIGPMMGMNNLANLVFDIDGDIIVSWVQPDAGTQFLRSKVKADGTTTAMTVGFDSSCEFGVAAGSCFAGVARDADGDRLLAYAALDEAGMQTSIHAQRYRGPETADLAVTIGTSAAEATVGDTVTITATVENLHAISDYYGNTTMDQAVGATSGVKMDFDLPASFTLPEDTGDWDCTQADESVSCAHPGMLYAGDKVTLAAVHETTSDDVGDYSLSATASADRTDPDAGNNTDEASLAISAAPKPDDGGDAGDGDTDDTPPATGGGGGGALGWLALLLAPLGLRARRRAR